jgi:hypothetical protein
MFNNLFMTILPTGNTVQLQGAELLKYSIALAAVGTFAMALVELFKSLTRARLFYNKWAVAQWTNGKPRNLFSLINVYHHQDNKALAELELLAVGGHNDTGSLYDQPVEKMMGQIQSAVNVAFEFPEHYPNLYDFITLVPESYWDRSSDGKTKDDHLIWKDNLPIVRRVRSQSNADISYDEKDTKDSAEAVQARTRLNNLIARKLDAFQNEIQYFWERLNQWLAGPIGAVIFYFAYSSSSSNNSILNQPTLIVFSIMAGILAPFAKQLSSSLASFGK